MAARTANRATKPRVSDQAVTRHLIVGVAASAGGLEAFTALLKRLLLDTGFGFVLVQHPDPQHDSALTHLLTGATSMPVREVTNNLRVQANCVYVIPPNSNFCIANAVLEPQPRLTAGAHRSIDLFFESLAQEQRGCGGSL
jgi:two-component system CheB/CheR fusion protein